MEDFKPTRLEKFSKGGEQGAHSTCNGVKKDS